MLAIVLEQGQGGYVLDRGEDRSLGGVASVAGVPGVGRGLRVVTIHYEYLGIFIFQHFYGPMHSV